MHVQLETVDEASGRDRNFFYFLFLSVNPSDVTATSWLLFKSLLSGAFCWKVIKSIPPRLPDIVYIHFPLSPPPGGGWSRRLQKKKKKKWNAAATTARRCSASIFILQTFRIMEDHSCSAEFKSSALFWSDIGRVKVVTWVKLSRRQLSLTTL